MNDAAAAFDSPSPAFRLPSYPRAGIFTSFFMAGYDCSTQRRRDGCRLDLLESTGHAQWAAKDYQSLEGLGIGTVRDGLRWHLIERRPGHYDWSSFLPMLRAARDQRLQVIWDLCHYGLPDGLDIWRTTFVDRFSRFCGAVAHLMIEEGVTAPIYSPINEISFWSWAGGEVGYFNPNERSRGQELKHQQCFPTARCTNMCESIAQFYPPGSYLDCLTNGAAMEPEIAWLGEKKRSARLPDLRDHEHIIRPNHRLSAVLNKDGRLRCHGIRWGWSPIWSMGVRPPITHLPTADCHAPQSVRAHA